GTCVDVCPMRLMPLKLAAFARAGKFEEAKATNLADCFECGCCAWACPSNIKIVSWIKYAKNYIRVKGI
ncbi:MAG: 4Fe-4S dicluster domain-containing protein, partial [Spirochaetota bacterium]